MLYIKFCLLKEIPMASKGLRWFMKWHFRGIARSLLLILAWQFIIQCSVWFSVQLMYMEKGEDEDSFSLLWKVPIGIVILSCMSLPVTGLQGESACVRDNNLQHPALSRGYSSVFWLMGVFIASASRSTGNHQITGLFGA